jgi:small-conductance mechanosensitive channel
MSEVKFTDDELKSIQELSQKSNDITNRFGQLAIAKINLEKQSESVESEEFKLHGELEALRKEEQETLNKITEKYGPGSLDPQTGVFTPTTEVQPQAEAVSEEK